MHSPSPDPARQAERDALVDAFVADPRSLVTDPRVIEAMRKTPRHRFVPDDLQAEAYRDRPLPIGFGQTISQPSLVAYMTQAIDPQAGDRILEIGTGSGYQAAVLSGLVAEIHSVEILAPLAERAARILGELGHDRVRIHPGDGRLGWPEAAPYDAILATCAPEELPSALVDQLREGGRLVAPIGPVGGEQELQSAVKRNGRLELRAVLSVRFVPMTGATAN